MHVKSAVHIVQSYTLLGFFDVTCCYHVLIVIILDHTAGLVKSCCILECLWIENGSIV